MRKPGKWFKIAAIPLVLVTLGASIAGCGSESATTTTTQVTTTVIKGDMVLDITAVGNLSYATSEELSFDTGGTVAEILVSVGDSVTEGQVVARLDMTEWQQNITDLESTLVSKQQALTQAEQTLTNAQRNVTNKERAVTAAEQNVEDMEYALTQAELAVTKTEINIEEAELNVEALQYTLDSNTGTQWTDENLALAKKSLAITKVSLDDAKHDVEAAQRAVTEAQLAVEDAKLDVEDAKTEVTIAEANVAKAEQDIVDAQTELDNAKATHPELTAAFDGLVIAINTEAGSEVLKGGSIITVVDPDDFQAIISVGETDISNVQVNANATVELDALPGIILPATVTAISPTATTSSGVVSYEVTIVIDSVKALEQGVTQEQVSQLKQGLTATVAVIYQEADDALQVLTAAISMTQEGYTVNVLNNGTITAKTITVGISDSKYTVVTSGLSEGDQVVYYKTVSSSASTTTASNDNNVMGGIMGAGGMGR